MKKGSLKFILLILIAFSNKSAFASQVDTVVTYSRVMDKNIKAVVILPEAYKTSSKIPVLFLLHGYSGNYSDFVKNAPEVKMMADRYKMIIVCPDGNYNSWYFDSPLNNGSKYETYISSELVSFLDEKYHTIKSPAGRAICGLSMGGHGALYLAIKHQDIFGAAGSMSGGVDIRPFSTSWDLEKLLGKYVDYPNNWENSTVINLIPLLVSGHLKLMIDCGTEDFFYKVNLNLHDQLLYRNIRHDFISRPGSHNWDYWKNSLRYQVLFMHNFFQGSQ